MRMRGRAVTDDARQLDFLTFSGPPRPPAPPIPQTILGGTETSEAGRKSTLPEPWPAAAAPATIGATERPTLPPVPADAQAPVAPRPQNADHYRITDDDRVGWGSLKEKCSANLQALELLKLLEAEGRPATAAEKRLLVRYVGWGGLPGVFDEKNAQWAKERARLTTLLSDEEFRSARATTLNAHYTSPLLITFMYAMLERMGFEGGRVLEPACGIGHFLGLMPEPLLRRSRLTAIEIDAVSSCIATLLYPDADVRHCPFEEAKLPDDFYDVAVSNIPFGDYRPFDARFKSWNFVIHDYFFAAALTKVRPGGLLVFITSKGTLDKADSTLREHLDRSADFLGAIRLPNTAFKKNAHTEVTTDIVVLRKRLPGEARAGQPWRQLGTITNSLGETIAVNEWFVARPDLMLGEMRLAGGLYRQGEPTLVSTGGELGHAMVTAVRHFPKRVFLPVERPPPSV